jgi:hypothetical protein
MVEQGRDSSKVNMFYAISLHRLYGQFFFRETTVAGETCLEMLLTGSCLSLQKNQKISPSSKTGNLPTFIQPYVHTQISICQTVGLVDPDRRIPFDEVAPMITGSNTLWFLFMGTH